MQAAQIPPPNAPTHFTRRRNRVGLLLDLDQGSMTVYMNDERLGVMVSSGLSGPFCWAVALTDCGDGAGIESAPLPASPPTAEELASAPPYGGARCERDQEARNAGQWGNLDPPRP